MQATNIQARREELLQLPLQKPNKQSKLDAISKYLKKLKGSKPDFKLAAQARQYNLEKFVEEVMEVVKQWIALEEDYSIATAALVFNLFEYEGFEQKLLEFVKALLSTGSRLQDASVKLKLMSVLFELAYANKRLPVGKLFSLISVNIDNYFVAYYYMQGLSYFFKLYDIQSPAMQKHLGPEDRTLIKKRLLVVKDIAVSLFQTQKQSLLKAHQKTLGKIKRGFVLNEQVAAQQNKQRQLIELKNCVELYCQQFQFVCALTYESIALAKEQPQEQNQTKQAPPPLSLYQLKDFEVLLPGILFQEPLDPDYQTREPLNRAMTEVIKRLSQCSNYKEADEICEELMVKFTCNQRASMLMNCVENPQFLALFSNQTLPLLVRIIATFCLYWKQFLPEINERVREKLDVESVDRWSSFEQRLLMLYAEFLKFRIADEHKFMSLFKNALESKKSSPLEQFIRSSAKGLLENTSTKERTVYLLSKSPYKQLAQ